MIMDSHAFVTTTAHGLVVVVALRSGSRRSRVRARTSGSSRRCCGRIGNAVPVRIGAVVAESLRQHVLKVA